MERFCKDDFDNLLGKYSSQFFAHLPKPDQVGRKPELLSEHLALTITYARLSAKANGLDGIIAKLVSDCIPQKLSHKQLLAEEISKWFWRAIAYHDLGKINPRFQKDRLNNKVQLPEVAQTSIGSKHSVLSTYLYLALFFREFIDMDLTDEEQAFLANTVLYMSYPIRLHHEAMLGECQNEDDWCEREEGMIICRKDLASLSPYIHYIDSSWKEENTEIFHDCYIGNANRNNLFSCFNEIIFNDELGFPLFALVKLLFSLLTASDYLSTAHYMNNWTGTLLDFGLITEDLRHKVVSNLRKTKVYNSQTFRDLEAGLMTNSDDYTMRNEQSLNNLRKALAMDVVRSFRGNQHERMFYIEAPTGSGKTNASMLVIGEMLRTDPTIQKVFYVFPFTTLITQTSKSLKETLGLSDGELVEFHSKAIKNTGKYEEDYINYLESQFLSVPYVLLSHVCFFNILKGNSKDYNYILPRMANSVVVIDELQSYPPSVWDKIVYLISNYAKYFNMRFILMSATLPKIDNLIVKENNTEEFVHLINNKKRYFQNPNFCNRVQIDYSLLKWESPAKDNLEEYLNNLFTFVSEESQRYAANNPNHPNSVMTIVEFIFKNTASTFLDMANRIDHCFDEVFFLTGTIVEPRRKYVINCINSEKAKSQKVLLITTQVVEAGVDIDMDLGFKDTSLIDSEEQLAGRINRNAKKDGCKLYLFDCNAEKILYGNDDRYKFTQELSFDDYKDILSKKDFDRLYQKVIDYITQKNQSNLIVNIRDFVSDVARLDYKDVDRSFQIISQKNTTVFVPLDIDINLIEPSFLAIADELEIRHENTLSGGGIWEKYKEVMTTQNRDFVLNRIRLNKIRSLMSLFTFSVFPESSEEKILRTYGKEEYGYLFLESFPEIYSFENGIDTSKFQESNFL